MAVIKVKNSLQGKKIFFIFFGSELGGAERQGLLFAKFLRECQVAEVEIWGLGANKPGRVAELCEEVGIIWRAVPFCWPDNGICKVWELVKLSILLRAEKPDILLPYTCLPNIVCGLIWKFTGAKLFIWNQRDEGRGLNFGLLHRWAVHCAPVFVSNSIIGKKTLINLYGIAESSIKVVHNGVLLTKPVDDRRAWRERLGITDGCFVVTMVANLHNYKDHPTLLHAWQKVMNIISNEGHRPPLLLLAGRFDDDNRVQELKAIAFDLDLGNNVRFLNRVDDITGLLMASDLCAHSSKYEGLPNGVLEAMAAGLPIVASDISGIREVVGSDNQKYLAALLDKDELAERIISFINNPGDCQSVGAHNRCFVCNNFSVEKMCEAMLTVLDGDYPLKTC